MAPHKTYSKKKSNMLLTIETGRVKRKPYQNDRRPLATLQSANVRPVKELVNKTKQSAICTRSVAVCNSSASKSSPSFPASEELSSIWNNESTFDKLLQTCPKPQPVVKEANTKTSPSYFAIETNSSASRETPVPTSRSKLFGLRPRAFLNKRKNNSDQSFLKSCLGCSNQSCYSKSANSENEVQLSSTPNVRNSIRPDITEFTPIYPEIFQADIFIPNETVSPLVEENVQEDLLPCQVLKPELAAGQTPRKPTSLKSTACKCVDSPDMFSSPPDMFSSPVASPLSLAREKNIGERVSKQPQSQSCASECLSNCDKDISINASDLLLKPSAANNSGDTTLTDTDSRCTCSSEFGDKVELKNNKNDVTNSNVSRFQLQPFEPENASCAVDAEMSFRSNVSTDFLMPRSSMTENDLDCPSCSRQDEEMAHSLRKAGPLSARISPVTSDCENSVRVKVGIGNVNNDVTTSSFGTVDSFQRKSHEPGNASQMVDVRTSDSSNFSTSSLMLKSSETEYSFDDPSCSQQDEDMADSLHRAATSKKRLSPIASDCENSGSLANDVEASPVQNFVNLRNRKVRWHDHLSLKNLSGQRSKSKIVETNSVEVDSAIDDQLETRTDSGTGTELKQVCQWVDSEQRAPTLCPSVACGRRQSIWLSSKARAASRRFSVVPGKLLAEPRPTSLGFRGLHGILAPPLAEQADFFDKLEDTVNNLTTLSATLSIVETPATQLDVSIKITARDVVLQKCDQDEPLPFDDAFPEAYLSKCRKIGEGLYGEVFMWEDGSQSSVIKVIPIAGDELINGERQKTFDEILSEIIITKELSDLRHAELVANHSEDLTTGFVEVKRTACVCGKYPQRLLQLWEEFAELSGTENDDPAVFSEDQLFIVLELANGGADLEKFQFNNSSQALSILLQTAYALAAAERRIEFEHRDLHWGNVLVSKTDVRHLEILMNGTLHKIPTNGVQVSIIDFTLSRMTYDGLCIYNDLSQDDSLFVSEGDYQFDIYRMMKENCRNDWREFVPANNVLWLHYIVDKMIAGVHYRKTSTKVHRDNLKKLGMFKRSLLNFSSTVDFVESLS